MSSLPLVIAPHCSLGLNKDLPGYTRIFTPVLLSFIWRAMICTISSRISPLPPGHWCDAFKLISAAELIAGRVNRLAVMAARDNFLISFIGILLVDVNSAQALIGLIVWACVQTETNVLKLHRATRNP